MNSGRQGELVFAKRMVDAGYIVDDVTSTEYYFDKDIDFFCINPSTHNARSFEVKYDERISQTGNLYLEILNRNSKQWNGGGWYKHCQADFLAYGDAESRVFYIIPMQELRARVKQLPCKMKSCDYDSLGYVVPLTDIEDLYIEI